ncbi:MAG: hypothetical protein F6K14_29810 [Symploca sp. SIO2C1]|nr:hypothetical protein [Symploca sp. SIO2C1]
MRFSGALEKQGSPDEKIFFTTMHENPSLRVPASIFKSEGRRQKAPREADRSFALTEF